MFPRTKKKGVDMGEITKIPGIPESIVRGIKAKSKKVSRAFAVTEKADLIQDGYVLVLQILKKRPDASPAYLMTALKRLYSVKKKKAYLETVRRVELTDRISEHYSAGITHPERRIDEERIVKRTKSKADDGEASKYAIMVLRDEYGLNHNEVIGLMGKEARGKKDEID